MRTQSLETDAQYAQRHVRQFKADSVSQIVAPGLGHSKLLVSRLQRNTPEHGITAPVTPDAVFSVLVQLRQQDRRELYLNDKLVHQGIFPERTVSVVDHWQQPKANLLSAFDTIIFTIPQSALNEVAADQRVPEVKTLLCEHCGRIDDTIWSLAQSLLPALERPDDVGTMYAERVLLASTTYFAHAFGGMRPATDAPHHLSQRELKRVTDFMQSGLQTDVSLSTLAAEFDLSPRNLVQSFRRTIGVTPDHWMRERRIDRAKDLLGNTSASIEDVAAACGFGSKAQFVRAFVSATGASPANWRKQTLN